jgi:uncharacterized DUF497 family protein
MNVQQCRRYLIGAGATTAKGVHIRVISARRAEREEIRDYEQMPR